MGLEIALDRTEHQHSEKSLRLAGLRASIKNIAMVGVALSLFLSGWYVRFDVPYKSNSDFAYYLGLIGGLLMLALLLYPLRKRIRFLHSVGPLRYWFRFHMVAGLLGPILVLFHSTFHVRSMNAMVALSSMLLVAASGIVGRFIYRRIHRGLYGCRTTHEELQLSLDRQLKELRTSAILPQEVKQEIERFSRLAFHVPEGRFQRVIHFVSLGIRRHLSGRRVSRTLEKHAKSARTVMHGTLASLNELLLNIDATLKAAQTTAQFTTYERLFSLWHAVHIPFLFMLVITALVHVVAVHAY